MTRKPRPGRQVGDAMGENVATGDLQALELRMVGKFETLYKLVVHGRWDRWRHRHLGEADPVSGSMAAAISGHRIGWRRPRSRPAYHSSVANVLVANVGRLG